MNLDVVTLFRFLSMSTKILLRLLIWVALLTTFSTDLLAEKSGGNSGSHRASSTHYRSPSGGHRSTNSPGPQRDSHGRIKRSSSEKKEFMKETGYPHGRKGYVIDHVVPLSKGGSDSPSNMQWQTKEDAKAKDKWERGQRGPTTKSKKHGH